MKMIDRLEWAYEWVIRTLVFFAGILLIFLMLSVGLEVCLRYFFGRPTSWVVEIAGYILLYIPFLVGAWVLKNEGHVKMDLFFNSLNRKTQYLLNGVTSIVGALICFVLSFYGVKVSLYLADMAYRTPTILMLPKSLIIAVIFVGSFLMALQFIFRARASLRLWKAAGRDPGASEAPGPASRKR
ncbi:MAG: TRAP transporter small permease [Desulfatiglandales bacterium]